MKEKVKQYGVTAFASLHIRNYRLYFIGQGIALTGMWLQLIGQSWLVFELTGSATSIGLVAAAQFLPFLLLGPVGGLIADRFPKRRILYITQCLSLILALTLGLLVIFEFVEVWMVFVLALFFGLVNMVDNPTRQTFVLDLVGREQLTNAVTLNSIALNLARVIGPLVAGLLIVTIGVGYCFLLNAVSYIVVLFVLWRMNGSDFHPSTALLKAKGQLREGFKYAWHTPIVRTILFMMTAIGMFAYEFQVVLPVLATETFGSSARGYSVLMGAMGVGAVIGGLVTAGRKNFTTKTITVAAMAFGVSMLMVAISPHIIVAVLCLVLVGFASVCFTAVASSTLQLQVAPEMRGRIMSLWTMAFIGSTPIGAPIVGYISEHASPRWGVAAGGFAALAVGIWATRITTRVKKTVTNPLPQPLL